MELFRGRCMKYKRDSGGKYLSLAGFGNWNRFPKIIVCKDVDKLRTTPYLVV